MADPTTTTTGPELTLEENIARAVRDALDGLGDEYERGGFKARPSDSPSATAVIDWWPDDPNPDDEDTFREPARTFVVTVEDPYAQVAYAEIRPRPGTEEKPHRMEIRPERRTKRGLDKLFDGLLLRVDFEHWDVVWLREDGREIELP